MRLLLKALAFAFLLTTAASAAEWSMDEQIEKTNVIVGGVCSGTIISKEERLVLTAYHCVDNLFTEETVKDIDPKTGVITEKKVQKKLPLAIWTNKVVDFEIVASAAYTAKIVGSDSTNDIALLQVKDVDFKPEMAVKLAPDSFVLHRGVKVYAVGNPGIVYDNSITEGIVSSPQRTITMNGVDYKFFQHSASIIGGNSGGSILNEHGELIGTVSAGLRGANIGFAVPISFTKDMIRKAGFGKLLEAK